MTLFKTIMRLTKSGYDANKVPTLVFGTPDHHMYSYLNHLYTVNACTGYKPFKCTNLGSSDNFCQYYVGMFYKGTKSDAQDLNSLIGQDFYLEFDASVINRDPAMHIEIYTCVPITEINKTHYTAIRQW